MKTIKLRNSLVMILSFYFQACSTHYVIDKSEQSPKKVMTSQTLVAQHKNVVTAPLSLKQIMADSDWIGRQPQSAFWSFSHDGIYYQQKHPDNSTLNLWYQPVDVANKKQKVLLKDKHFHAYKEHVLNVDKSIAAWVFEGSVFIRYLAEERTVQLTRDSYSPYNLTFLHDGRLSYQLGNAIYAISLGSGLTKQLISWQFGESPTANKRANDFVSKEQQSLLDVIKHRRGKNTAVFNQQQQLSKANIAIANEPFYFSKDSFSKEVSLSPNGKWLILLEEKSAVQRKEHDIMPNYINENGRISVLEVRTSVSEQKPPEQKLWLVDLVKHRKRQLRFSDLIGYNEDVLADVKREYALSKGVEYQENRLPRNISLMNDWYWSQSAIQWHKNGQHVAIMLEAWDNKDRWLTTVDLAQAKLINQHRLHDDAWINYKLNSFGWLNHSTDLYYLSEESGYAHIYIKPINKKAKALTFGEYVVDELTLSADDESIYFKANIKHPGIYEIYKVSIQTGEIKQLTNLNGMTDYSLSPNEQSLLLTHSSLIKPPELFVQHLNGKAAKQITDTTSKAFLDINWVAPDIVPIQSSHISRPIFSRVYGLKNNKQGNKQKAVIFNHGAGYLQNAHLGWSSYFREFMFHNFLVQQGYVVLDMDYRASAGYGRDWRTAIYRQMGTPEVQDLEDGVKWLVDNLHVDPERIGTYGGSYGGFLTFMAMFKKPDLFKAGAALRPVSDWAYYEHGYTSNILNTPEVDPMAYRKSSPIYFAQGLANPLLINAPMADNNVFFIDVVRLVQRLIELEKENFETAIYPAESHGFEQASSWLDEYRRIFKLFEQNL